jgi:hypothetical protein
MVISLFIFSDILSFYPRPLPARKNNANLRPQKYERPPTFWESSLF